MQVAKATPSDVTPVPSSQQENREAQEIPKPGDPIVGHFQSNLLFFFTQIKTMLRLGLVS